MSGGKVLGEESDVSRTARLVKAKLRMGRGDGEADSGRAIRGQLSRAANARKGLLLFSPDIWKQGKLVSRCENNAGVCVHVHVYGCDRGRVEMSVGSQQAQLCAQQEPGLCCEPVPPHQPLPGNFP